MRRASHIPRAALLLAALCALALAALLALPSRSPAAEAPAAPASAPAQSGTTTVPAPAPEAGATTTTAPGPAGAPPPLEATPVPVPSTPQVQGQTPQGVTPSTPGPASPAHSGGAGAVAGAGEGEAAAGQEALKGPRAVSPATLTPALPLAISSSLQGLPGFFIESFRVPPFLLPIYQAAGTAYGIPWQVLAAINEVETDYGRDLSVSSAGAEGWMQFLPASWTQYGVDANGDGYEDPYNPADAIFAAARYLRAAGGQSNIKAAIFSYNHSQAYVETVLLRATLLGGTPEELLGAITGLTEARFPVHAAAHFSDGYAALATTGSSPARELVGTTIYSQPGAPVIAVQDGTIAQIGQSAALGRFIVLRDAFGNTYTYAHLGDIAALYPVLAPHVDSTVASRIARTSEAHEPAPSGPASAGAQPRSPVSEGAAVSGLALGAAASLEAAPARGAPAPPPILAPKPPARARVSSFRAGVEDVFLHPLHAGVQVIAGTVLGHVGARAGAPEGAPHVLFQIRPAGLGAPLIDPKPILDGWVALENSSVFRARGENPFLATSPTTGQVLLESKQQLQPQVLRDSGIRLSRCGRADVQGGRVDKRVLALLEYLSVSGLKPTAGGLRCSDVSASAANASAGQSSEALNIVAIDGVPVAGHQGPGSLADAAVRKLLALQGVARPTRIVSQLAFPGTHIAVTAPAAASAIKVTFAPAGGLAHAAGLGGSELTPSEWIKLIARLGEIPDPSVSRAPSAAAIRDTSTSAGHEGGAGGNH
jgi:hypothetical protein